MIRLEQISPAKEAQQALEIERAPEWAEKHPVFPLVIKKWPRSARLGFKIVAGTLLWLPILYFLRR